MDNNAILIDSINIKTLFLCLCNRKCEIIVLFRPLTLNQKCYVYLLSLMGSKLKFHNFNLEILPKIYKKTHNDTKLIVTEKYADTIIHLSEYDLAMGFIFRVEIAKDIYDVMTIYNYIYYCIKLDKKVNKIYIGNNRCDFPPSFFDRKVSLYRSKKRKKLNHENFLNTSGINLIYSIISVIHKIFNIRVLLKNKLYFDVQGVVHGHGTFKNENGKLISTINNLLLKKYNVISINANTYFLRGTKTGYLNHISMGELLYYFKSIFNFIFYTINQNNVSLHIYFEMLKHWIISIQIEIFLKNVNCKFVYADYESPYSHCLLSQASKNPNMKSFSHTNSLGYFPELRRYRCSEYLFVWGNFMKSLLEESGHDSKQVVTVGYPNETHNQFYQSQIIRKKYIRGYQGIIVVYDTSVGGSYCSECDMIEMLISVIKIATIKNYYVLIKSKKKLLQSIVESLKTYEGTFSVIDAEMRGSMSCGFAADLVVGYGLSTIPNILASYGKKIVLYDPYDNLWDKYPYYKNKYKVVSRDLKSFEKNVIYWINYHGDPLNFSFIDPYVDHAGSDRIIKFIDSLLL